MIFRCPDIRFFGYRFRKFNSCSRKFISVTGVLSTSSLVNLLVNISNASSRYSYMSIKSRKLIVTWTFSKLLFCVPFLSVNEGSCNITWALPVYIRISIKLQKSGGLPGGLVSAVTLFFSIRESYIIIKAVFTYNAIIMLLCFKYMHIVQIVIIRGFKFLLNILFFVSIINITTLNTVAAISTTLSPKTDL